jgi:hypothetical protein
VNNDELVKSLRTEMQTYLKNTVADLQQEIAEMQERVNQQIEQHRNKLNNHFQNLLSKGSAASINDDFTRVVAEHLKIAYEDGSKEAASEVHAEAEQRAAGLEQQLGEARARAEEAEQHLTQLQNQTAENEQQFADLRSQLEEARQRLAEMQTEVVNARQLLAEAEKRSDEHQNLLAAARTAAQENETRFAALHRKTQEQENRFVEMQTAREVNANQHFAALDKMHAAVNEISSQNTQADILKALVKHAGNFAPRGAFFIVKSEHLVGWRVFGSETNSGDESVREVFLAVSSDSLLGESIRQNAVQRVTNGGRAADRQYLQKLKFGSPSEMTAIPLIVRGRAVAVLYADSGENSSSVQTAALETLVRVAGLTVELLAAAKSPAAKTQVSAQETVKSNAFAPAATSSSAANEVEKSYNNFALAPAETGKLPAENFNYQTGFAPVVAKTPAAPEPEINVANETAPAFAPPAENFSFEPQQPSAVESFAPPAAAEQTMRPTETSFAFDMPQPNAETAAPQSVRKYGERNLELPIDVPEDERRLHNDARRFARLLVSEIKLYNEQKVKEGRQAGDLYARLREAVDRSREMYDKRVAPPVAARFDYFNYELVNTLAEGDQSKLGSDYPGASV